MSSELSLFSEFNTAIEAPVQSVFDWDATFAETQELVKEDAELTSTIDEAMVKRFHGRVKIGQNLLALQSDHSKHRHGDFTTTVLPDLDIDRKFAYRCIGAANLVARYENSIVPSLGQLNIFDHPLPMDTWNQLSTSTVAGVVIKQVASGEIDATPKAIKEANERAKRAEQDLEAKQKELDLFKESTKRREQNREQIHTSQILAATEAEDQAKLAKDQAEKRLKTLQEQTADGLMSPETKEQLEKLQSDLVAREAELKERTSQRDSLAQLREQLVKELEEQRDANKARREQEMYEHKINDRVKKITEEWGKCSVTLLGQLPSPIESQVVTDNNWALLDHAADMTQKIFEAIRQVRITKDSVFLNSEVESNAH
jgi:DNA repair exonuclease SbcCD ATPase subunit